MFRVGGRLPGARCATAGHLLYLLMVALWAGEGAAFACFSPMRDTVELPLLPRHLRTAVPISHPCRVKKQ